MTARRCHGCGQPLGEAHLLVHDAQNPERNGRYHLGGCFARVTITISSTMGSTIEVAPGRLRVEVARTPV
jgi:hypothetical protein